MNKKTLYYGFGALTFLITFIVYAMTAQPSVPFWDCGEFSAATTWQQVPHPPGAPLFLMLGKVFQILIPFGDLGWRVNMMSVTMTAGAVFLMYLVIVKVIKNFRTESLDSVNEQLIIYGSAFVGAITYCFTDTLWFNGVESEVYASSSFFVALCVYLMMRWHEEADKPGHERYLLMIAYIIGLSTGVHLLSVLTLFSIILLVSFKKYKVTTKSMIWTVVIGVVIFFIIYYGVILSLPTLLGGDLPIKTAAREYIVENNPVMIVLALGAIALIVYGFYKGFKESKQILALATFSFLLMGLGYTSYTQVVVRAHSHSPMNENEPLTFDKLSSYLGREQYGEAPNWPRRYQKEDYYTRNYSKYGKWEAPAKKEVERKDGTGMYVDDFKNINFAGELKYMWGYQIDHMYLRYFFWNFVGRESDMQDAEAAWFSKTKRSEEINYKSGYAKYFPTQFYALPLLLGLIGLFFQFYKDPKMGYVYLLMFLMMGVLATLQQNQQDPQPRERDYFYTGSFAVFCIWIALGVVYLIDWLAKNKPKIGITGGVIALCLAIVPIQMGVKGWNYHSRAGNWIPFDYSYNILQSTEKDAILITNGDNDTFPLWYLQDVEGVRRDVRIVNLSLANTLWYVDQLKNRSPWGAKKVPLSFADDSLHVDETSQGALSYDFDTLRTIRIPVDREILKQYTNNPEIINHGTMEFQFKCTPYGERDGKKVYLYQVRDKVVLEMLLQTKFKRPIYYSATVGSDVYDGLDKFLRMEGMAYRVCPVVQSKGAAEGINPDIMEKCLMNVDNSDNYSKEPKYGFKFRNLNNPSVYYDEVHRRLMRSYRELYTSYSAYMLEEKHDSTKAYQILDMMNKNISVEQFPLSFDQEYKIARIYNESGAKAQMELFAKKGIKSCEDMINNNNLEPGIKYYEIIGRYFGPYRACSALYEMLGNYKKSRDILQNLENICEQYLKEGASSANSGSSKARSELQRVQYNIVDLLANLDDMRITEIEKTKGKSLAIDSAKAIIAQYSSSDDQIKEVLKRYMVRRLKELTGDTAKTGLASSGSGIDEE